MIARRLFLAALFLASAFVGVLSVDDPPRVFEFDGTVCVEQGNGFDCRWAL